MIVPCAPNYNGNTVDDDCLVADFKRRLIIEVGGKSARSNEGFICGMEFRDEGGGGGGCFVSWKDYKRSSYDLGNNNVESNEWTRFEDADLKYISIFI